MTSSEVSEVLPSCAQLQYHYLGCLNGASHDVRLCASFRLTGELDVPLLVSAVRMVVNQHGTLRLRLGGHGARLALTLAATVPERPLRLVRAVTGSPEHFDLYVRRRIRAMCSGARSGRSWRPFELALFRLDEASHVLALVASHLAVDGRALDTIVRRLFTLYFDLVNKGPMNKDDAATAAPAPESDSVRQVMGERRLMERDQPANDRFWAARLHGRPPALRLTAAEPAPTGGAVSRSVPSAQIRASARVGRCSGFVVALTAFVAELFTRTTQDRILVHVPVDLRTPEAHDAVGMFAMQLPVLVSRSWLHESAAALTAVRDQVLSAVRHRYVDPARMISLMLSTRPLGVLDTTSVIATHIEHRHPPPEGRPGATAGPRIERFPLRWTSPGFPGGMLLSVVSTAGPTTLSLEYAGSLLGARDAESLLAGVAARISTGRFDTATDVAHAGSDRTCPPRGGRGDRPRTAAPDTRDTASEHAMRMLLRELPHAHRTANFWTSGGTVELIAELAEAFPSSAIGRGDWRVFRGLAAIGDIAAALVLDPEGPHRA
jgi:Condensation domain